MPTSTFSVIHRIGETFVDNAQIPYYYTQTAKGRTMRRNTLQENSERNNHKSLKILMEEHKEKGTHEPWTHKNLWHS